MTINDSNATAAQVDPAEFAKETSKPVSVLFVCLGNICRSTMAEGVFQHLTHPSGKLPHPLIDRIDSCGTGGYHIGDGPDSRTMATLRANGITTYVHKARKFATRDFEEFDYILAMDDDNLEHLEHLRARYVRAKGGDESGVGKVCLFGEFGGKKRRDGRGEEIEDPYYGGKKGFDVAYAQSVRFGKAFLDLLEKGGLE